MNPPLKSLEQHNRENFPHLAMATERANGIACPDCFSELFDRLGTMLMSNPPQTPIFCKKCGYSGSRY